MPEPADSITPLYGFPYPVDLHSADGPLAFQRLAQAVEDWLEANVPYHGAQKTIAAEQSQPTTGAVELGTPDRVSLLIPENAHVFLTYEAQVYGGGTVALYVDGVEEITTTGTDLPVSTYAPIGTADLVVSGSRSPTPPRNAAPKFVWKIGSLGNDFNDGSTRFGPMVLTGLDDGEEHVFSVRFAGITAKERQLRVWAQPFVEG